MLCLQICLTALSFQSDFLACFVGFVDNFDAEKIRVQERLDNVNEHPTTGREHFWLHGYHARILATL